MKQLYFLLATIFLSSLQAQTVDPSLFRYSQEENRELARRTPQDTLSHRIFYEKPSEGPDAQWFDAVKQGNTETILKMIKDGQDINVKDEASLGENALFWASFLGYMDIVKTLMKEGADFTVNSRADGKDAIKAAVLGGHVDVFNYLLPTSVEKDPEAIHAIEDDGETFLMVAVWNYRVDMVKRLLELGVNPNAKALGKGSSTALSYARKRNYPDLETILIEAGATE